jgi:hypothetical protein
MSSGILAHCRLQWTNVLEARFVASLRIADNSGVGGDKYKGLQKGQQHQRSCKSGSVPRFRWSASDTALEVLDILDEPTAR